MIPIYEGSYLCNILIYLGTVGEISLTIIYQKKSKNNFFIRW